MTRLHTSFNHNPLLESRVPGWRARVVLALMLIGSTVLVGRAMYLQGVNQEFLQRKGESRYARTLELPATRGKVVDRHGDTLATSTPVKSIAAIPDMAQLSPAQVIQLAKVLEVEPSDINRRLSSGRDYVYLARAVAPDVAEAALALKLPGIQAQDEYRRYYPAGEMVAHMVGFTNIDDKGQEGIELAFNDQLSGQPGSRRVIKDRRGQIVEDVETIRRPQDGATVQLALDSKIQFLAYSALKQAVQNMRAKSGAALVVDARTGEVLALVNNPTYNPNNRSRLSGEQLRNRVVTDSFEPGSTMKPFVAAMALESNRFRADTLVDVNGGQLTLDGATIRDSHHQDGPMTVAQIIQKSSNIGSAKMALTFAPEQMWQTYSDLGFGQPVRVGFPGEVGGRLRPWKTWRPIEQATMAYGHGVSVTTMQLVHAYMAFAREGELIPLSLTRVDAPVVHGKRVFSREVASQVLGMMESVVAPGGTATRAAVPGYRIAGKTGTAHKLENGRYTNKYLSSFVGIAPASDPRLIVAVIIDEPSAGKHFGGEVAGPVFSQITAGALRTLGIRPDAPPAPLRLASQNVGNLRGDM
ncbi:MAG: cell division protein [Candidatus Dactylopiibacterium carminicum]|uniref:Peptidoglycan D,D-transpeptidase FtsI n=1 Tax=Candidatus Dactylopiibacterium carminicum TaxID=857335 RepID=A0A272EQS6_9RHOO|nr:penicillin-binding protein 2 [Candidatus Dactylopiibacterium carminicum]KAF7599280.1 penicillin-binding protein 2 [Candidatus Dactylopiibacterium carminicum]PAS92442.1 MAG: cell division protein [Candidatus Dactylopiibacterium carminicum]PAS97170.1 MAG: cell division protein [Candidatus Dactylopiibacterium carminicum]PAS99286.1 MAG: cell division protein [Candidatus Dactylopiibacterium carminicum]